VRSPLAVSLVKSIPSLLVNHKVICPVNCPVSDWTNQSYNLSSTKLDKLDIWNLPDRKPARALQPKQQAICVRSHKSFIDPTSSLRQNIQ